MEISHSEHRVSFKIEPKIGGGFVAHYERPPNPPVTLEAATREDLQQKIREHMADILGPKIAAQLPASFFDALNKPGDRQHFTFKESFKIGADLGHGVPATPAMLDSIASSSEEDFGPIRRTGDGTNWMMLLKFAVATLVVIAILLFLKRS